jgi:hypothetical protein
VQAWHKSARSNTRELQEPFQFAKNVASRRLREKENPVLESDIKLNHYRLLTVVH